MFKKHFSAIQICIIKESETFDRFLTRLRKNSGKIREQEFICTTKKEIKQYKMPTYHYIFKIQPGFLSWKGGNFLKP